MAAKQRARVRMRLKEGKLLYFDVLEMQLMPLEFLTEERARLLYPVKAF